MLSGAFLAPEGDPEDLRTLEDVAAAELTLGVPGAGPYREIAAEAGVPHDDLVVSALGVSRLESGGIDAYFAEAVSLRSLAEDEAGVEAAEARNAPEVGFTAFVLPDRGAQREALLNEAFGELHAHRAGAARVQRSRAGGRGRGPLRRLRAVLSPGALFPGLSLRAAPDPCDSLRTT